MNYQDLITFVNERRAVRAFDPTAEISKTEIRDIIQLAIQAPSAWNLQHWKFLVFHDHQSKEKLLPIANNQKHVLDASAVIAVLGDLEAHRNAEAVLNERIRRGNITEEAKQVTLEQIERNYQKRPHFARDDAIRNASLAAMQLMLVAKAKGFDTCPMGGFKTKKLQEAFHIPNRYLPIMLIAIGKSIRPAPQPPRFSVDEVVIWEDFQHEA